MFFSFLNFIKFTPCKCCKPFTLKTRRFSRVPLVSYFTPFLEEKNKKYIFFMKCSPQIALYVSSCFMQSLLRCSRVELLAYGQASGENQRNTKTIFIQHFLNVLIPWSPWISFFFVSFLLFLFLLHRHSWNFLHIIRREKASQKAHSHHQDKHYRTGSLSQRGREGSGGGALQWRVSEEGGAGDEEGVFKSITNLKRKKKNKRRGELLSVCSRLTYIHSTDISLAEYMA